VAKPWLTREIRDGIGFKRYTNWPGNKNSRPENWEQFRIYQRKKKGLIKKGKIEYKSELAGN